MIGWKMLKQMWRDLSMWSKLGLIVSLTIFAGVVTGCNWKLWKNYPQDNFVEEIIEDVIEHKTGIDIDLSPFSDEAKKLETKKMEWESSKPVEVTTRFKFINRETDPTIEPPRNSKT